MSARPLIRSHPVWNRVEKVTFMVTDLCLQAYFVHLVRANLLSNGLTKYRFLFRVNVGMIFFSISMDVGGQTSPALAMLSPGSCHSSNGCSQITLIGLLSMGNV